MNTANWIRPLFWLAAAYDGILGAIFLASPSWVFTQFNVAPPNHFAYVQFPAALLIIFAVIFATIARDPVGNRSQIVYGILLKVAYCSIAGYYWLTSDIPIIWKPFVWADLVMGVLFVIAYVSLNTGSRSTLVRA
ncbi:MAG: hypothetical protein WD669_08905 [Pirellulales bacterium]